MQYEVSISKGATLVSTTKANQDQNMLEKIRISQEGLTYMYV